MATKYFTGRAVAVSQVSKVAIATSVVGTVYSITVNGRSASYTATGAVLGPTIASLVNAFNSSPYPELQELFATAVGDGVHVQSKSDGVPFTVTGTANSTPLTVTSIRVATGPEHWDAPQNWSGDTLPAAGDDIILEEFDGSIKYGLTDANNYASLSIAASFTGAIGLPAKNERGYPEYRPRRLTLGTSAGDLKVDVGRGFGAGSSRLLFDFNSSKVELTVNRTSQSLSNSPAFDAIGIGATSVGRFYGGSCKVHGSFDSVDVFALSQESQPVVDLGTSSITVLSVNGGSARYGGNVATVYARSGANVKSEGTATSATVVVSDNSTIEWNSEGNITTTLDVQGGGKVDFSKVATTKTVAACKLFSGGSVNDPMGRVTFTTKIALQGCRIKDVNVDLGVGYSI